VIKERRKWKTYSKESRMRKGRANGTLVTPY
jgi:hypothetical protein